MRAGQGVDPVKSGEQLVDTGVGKVNAGDGVNARAGAIKLNKSHPGGGVPILCRVF